jgi:hypothetical protein
MACIGLLSRFAVVNSNKLEPWSGGPGGRRLSQFSMRVFQLSNAGRGICGGGVRLGLECVDISSEAECVGSIISLTSGKTGSAQLLPDVREFITRHTSYTKLQTRHWVGEGRAIRRPHYPTVLADR